MSERTAELFVDPACPFAWMTSRWLHHAAEVRAFTPRFSVMSLAVLNEGRELDPGYRRSIDDPGVRPVSRSPSTRPRGMTPSPAGTPPGASASMSVMTRRIAAVWPSWRSPMPSCPPR